MYYTPAPIVDYVVNETMGRLLAGKRPPQVSRLRIVDPACGGGLFLVRAYQYLIDWHRQWYLADGPTKHAGRIGQGCDEQWSLTTAEKQRILRNNIYGVDVDRQAVEVTKCSLFLKMLEEEHQRRPTRQLDPPNLAGNIKCGDALVGPDFYADSTAQRVDETTRAQVNAFDWAEEFPAVFARADGGFDAVVGNPPWGQKAIANSQQVKRYVRSRYTSVAGIYDLFRPFVEKGVTLLRAGGQFGMVLPDIVLLKDYVATRRFLLDQLRLEAIDWWGMAFPGAVIDAATIVGCRARAQANHAVRVAIHDADQPLRHEIPQADFAANPRGVQSLSDARQAGRRHRAGPTPAAGRLLRDSRGSA